MKRSISAIALVALALQGAPALAQNPPPAGGASGGNAGEGTGGAELPRGQKGAKPGGAGGNAPRNGAAGQGQMRPGPQGQGEAGQDNKRQGQQTQGGAEQDRMRQGQGQPGQGQGDQDQRRKRGKGEAGQDQNRQGEATKGGINQGAIKSEENGARAAAHPPVSIRPEQRTRITETVRTLNVRPVTNIGIGIAVGRVIPRTVALQPLPPTIIEIVPEFRRYRFVLVPGEIVIVDPVTFEIVDVIEI